MRIKSVLPKLVRGVCLSIDKLFIRLSSAVTLADISQIEEINGIPNSNIVAIYDSPPDIAWESEKTKNKKYTLFFAGQLTQSRQLNLDKVIAACEMLTDVQLIIAGDGDLVEKIKQKTIECPEKVVFLGELSHQEVLEQSRNADLLFVLRNPIVTSQQIYLRKQSLRSNDVWNPNVGKPRDLNSKNYRT